MSHCSAFVAKSGVNAVCPPFVLAITASLAVCSRFEALVMLKYKINMGRLYPSAGHYMTPQLCSGGR